MAIRLVIADDHVVFRAGLASLLAMSELEVVGEAANGIELIDQVKKHQPDLVLTDLSMPKMGGLEAIRLIKADHPNLPVVVLTASEEDADLFEAVKSGAQGYLLKSLAPETVIQLVRSAAAGEPALTAQLAAKILAEFSRLSQLVGTENKTQTDVESIQNALDPLTPRELDVLTAIERGASNKDIARKLWVTENTVKFHLRNILQKLHLHNRSQVVAYALQRRAGQDATASGD